MPIRYWRCPDCGLPNVWDILECVRCHLIQPPDRERWEFKPLVCSNHERLPNGVARVESQRPLWEELRWWADQISRRERLTPWEDGLICLLRQAADELESRPR
jgi:hypothetical protein